MTNNSLSAIARKLKSKDKILLFPHVRADGDAIGSATALCAALRKLGKQAFVLVGDEVAENLRFLAGDHVTSDCGILGTPDICVAVDCSDAERFSVPEEVFLSASDCRICIDHHATAESYADLNYIDPAAAATGELIYELLLELGTEIDGGIADAVYAAIHTDTGGFRYSNTTKKTHQIVAALFDCGLDHCAVCNRLYDNVRGQQIAVHAEALSGMELFAGGLGALSCVSREMLAETGAVLAETDGIVEKLRSIRGVEIAVLLKETEDGIKVSLRSQDRADVARVAQRFGGGGHMRAAGCTIRESLSEAKAQIRQAAEEELRQSN